MVDAICSKCGVPFKAKTARKKYCSWKCRPSSAPEERAKHNVDIVKAEARKGRWAKNNPDKNYASLKKWRANNPEKARQLNKNWEDANPDKKKSKVINSSINRRGREKAVFSEKINSIEIYERDRWVCHICKSPIDRYAKSPHPLSPSLDHVIPLSRGGHHSALNIKSSHLRCNLKKHTSIISSTPQP
jgi:hypothetical protein